MDMIAKWRNVSLLILRRPCVRMCPNKLKTKGSKEQISVCSSMLWHASKPPPTGPRNRCCGMLQPLVLDSDSDSDSDLTQTPRGAREKLLKLKDVPDHRVLHISGAQYFEGFWLLGSSRGGLEIMVRGQGHKYHSHCENVVSP